MNRELQQRGETDKEDRIQAERRRVIRSSGSPYRRIPALRSKFGVVGRAERKNDSIEPLELEDVSTAILDSKIIVLSLKPGSRPSSLDGFVCDLKFVRIDVDEAHGETLVKGRSDGDHQVILCFTEDRVEARQLARSELDHQIEKEGMNGAAAAAAAEEDLQVQEEEEEEGEKEKACVAVLRKRIWTLERELRCQRILQKRIRTLERELNKWERFGLEIHQVVGKRMHSIIESSSSSGGEDEESD